MQTGPDSIAHIIQIALTPIFLLVGVAGLLNVFSTRHSYVTQHVDQVLADIRDHELLDKQRLHVQLENLRSRSRMLDVAVVFGVLSGVSTCLAAALLLVNELSDNAGRDLLFVVFGAALLFSVAALAIFALEMSMSGKGLRSKILWAEIASGKTPAAGAPRQ